MKEVEEGGREGRRGSRREGVKEGLIASFPVTFLLRFGDTVRPRPPLPCDIL